VATAGSGGGGGVGAPRPQRLGHAPGLRDAAARLEQRVVVGDLGHGSEAVIGEVTGKRREESCAATASLSKESRPAQRPCNGSSMTSLLSRRLGASGPIYILSVPLPAA